MTQAGERLIAAADEAAELARKDIDSLMLQSMATAIRCDLGFSFNREDMADLLERMSVLAALSSKSAPTP